MKNTLFLAICASKLTATILIFQLLVNNKSTRCHDPTTARAQCQVTVMGVLDMTLAHLAPKEGDANSGAASGQRARNTFADKTQA